MWNPILVTLMKMRLHPAACPHLIGLLLGPLGGNWNDKQKALRIKRMTQNAKHRPPLQFIPKAHPVQDHVREGRGSILGMLAFLST